MKKLVIFVSLLVLISGCNDDDMKKIKEGRLNTCPDYTIEELVDNYTENPKWIKKKSNNGYYVYDVTGSAYHQKQLSEVSIQFAISNGNVVVTDFIIDGVSESSINTLITDICEVTRLEKDKISKTFKDIPVSVLYNEEAYVVESDDEFTTVDVIISGSQSDIDTINDSSEYKVILDLTEYSDSNTKQKASFTFTSDNDNLSYEIKPSYVYVTISKKVSMMKIATVELVNKDKLASNLTIKNATLQYSEVIVKGSEDSLDKIDSVKALIDLESFKFDKAGTYEISSDNLIAYDKAGNVLKNIEFVPSKLVAEIVIGSN